MRTGCGKIESESGCGCTTQRQRQGQRQEEEQERVGDLYDYEVRVKTGKLCFLLYHLKVYFKHFKHNISVKTRGNLTNLTKCHFSDHFKHVNSAIKAILAGFE